MEIEVIIPNYNGAHLIEKNLPAVLKAVEHYNSTVTIVDDCSEIEDFQKLEHIVAKLKEKNTDQITLLRNTKNVGFSGTVNRAALASKAEFIVLLNSDVVPEKNFLNSPLSKLKANANLFGVGCMDKSIENGNVVLRGRGVGKFERGFLVHRKGNVDKSNTLWISGGSSVVRTSLFQKIGGFDELFNPFYWEDIDLSYRALKAGYDILFDKDSVVEHRHEEGAIKKHHTSKKVRTTAYRNQIIFMWKNVTDVSLLITHIIFLPYHVINTLRTGDTAFITGYFWAKTKLPRIIAKRMSQKKMFRKSDQQVIATARL